MLSSNKKITCTLLTGQERAITGQKCLEGITGQKCVKCITGQKRVCRVYSKHAISIPKSVELRPWQI